MKAKKHKHMYRPHESVSDKNTENASDILMLSFFYQSFLVALAHTGNMLGYVGMGTN